MTTRAANAAVAIVALLALGPLGACSPQGADDSAAVLTLHLEPDPPRVGPARLEIVARDRTGMPLIGGALRAEGNMSHAGMRPSLADCDETRPGTYACDLELTMAGDWFVQVDATFPDGTRARETFDVAGVEAR